MLSKANSTVYSPASYAAAHTVMSSLFTKAFVDLLDNAVSTYSNTGSFTFTPDDGNYTTTITVDGTTTIGSVVDAVNSLYAVYSITPAMVNEVPVNMGMYFPAGTLPTLGYLSDIQDFTKKPFHDGRGTYYLSNESVFAGRFVKRRKFDCRRQPGSRG